MPDMDNARREYERIKLRIPEIEARFAEIGTAAAPWTFATSAELTALEAELRQLQDDHERLRLLFGE